MKKEFQIEQSYSNGAKAWIYFKTFATRVKTIEQLAIKEAREDWSKINHSLYFGEPEKPRPTIKVVEYKYGKKVKNGINFKVKWR